MANITWNDAAFKKNIKTKAVDGLEEWGLTVWRPQAAQNAPKKSGTMAGSLGVERGPDCVYVGGGGQAKAYILKQELDESLTHAVGHAGFIRGAVTDNAKSLPAYVQKHIK